jgi:hypothetical protein
MNSADMLARSEGDAPDDSAAARAETETLARRVELLAQAVLPLSRELRELRDGAGR